MDLPAGCISVLLKASSDILRFANVKYGVGLVLKQVDGRGIGGFLDDLPPELPVENIRHRHSRCRIERQTPHGAGQGVILGYSAVQVRASGSAAEPRRRQEGRWFISKRTEAEPIYPVGRAVVPIDRQSYDVGPASATGFIPNRLDRTRYHCTDL